MTPQITKWLIKFKSLVNTHAGGDFLQFTLSVWDNNTGNNESKIKISDKISIVKDNFFPYLDMDLQ